MKPIFGPLNYMKPEGNALWCIATGRSSRPTRIRALAASSCTPGSAHEGPGHALARAARARLGHVRLCVPHASTGHLAVHARMGHVLALSAWAARARALLGHALEWGLPGLLALGPHQPAGRARQAPSSFSFVFGLFSLDFFLGFFWLLSS